jgi:hypothetical protein
MAAPLSAWAPLAVPAAVFGLNALTFFGARISQ